MPKGNGKPIPRVDLPDKASIWLGAVDLAERMGVELMDEETYRLLQQLGDFDTTTESWVSTPKKNQRSWGALFMCKRYDTVFVYHNGARSFYGSRGFRGMLKI